MREVRCLALVNTLMGQHRSWVPPSCLHLSMESETLKAQSGDEGNHSGYGWTLLSIFKMKYKDSISGAT